MPSTVSQDFLDAKGAIRLADAAAIDGQFPGGFIAWFNANLANQGAWQDKAIPNTPACRVRFKQFWDDTADVFANQPSLLQFACLMSIFINEVSGDLLPIREKVGLPQHPGIAYAFDAIPNLKRSYNTMGGNKTARVLFADPVYRAAHGQRPGAAAFANVAAISPAWGGERYPAGFSTSSDETVNGFILQADFFKFRGRGLIQTTGRANYLKLIEFVKTYAGGQPVVAEFAAKWVGQPADAVATASSNQDWDRLFLDSELVIARAAIAFHNQASGNYLALAQDDADTLNSESPGSIHRMGLRISGGNDYANKYRERVCALCEALGSAQV